MKTIKDYLEVDDSELSEGELNDAVLEFIIMHEQFTHYILSKQFHLSEKTVQAVIDEFNSYGVTMVPAVVSKERYLVN